MFKKVKDKLFNMKRLTDIKICKVSNIRNKF